MSSGHLLLLQPHCQVLEYLSEEEKMNIYSFSLQVKKRAWLLNGAVEGICMYIPFLKKSTILYSLRIETTDQ